MIPGISGPLLSHDALSHDIPLALHGLLGESAAPAAHRHMQAWHLAATADMGPACGSRAVFDRIAAPFAVFLGFSVIPAPSETSRLVAARLAAGGSIGAVLIATAWGEALQGAWREAVFHGIAAGVRWCFCATGPILRVIDARRTYSRRFVEFELEWAGRDERAFAVLWGLLRAEAFTAFGAVPLLDRAVALSERHRSQVRASLQHGVEESLSQLVRALAGAARTARQREWNGTTLMDESLVIVYRILFLLFAEARNLVPSWHPVYRDSYTIESLRRPVELLPRPRGVWEALQAIARLARHGCRAGTLNVPPFNGRLFSEVDAPRAESVALGDGAVRQVLLALTTRPGRNGRERISYADLGVEQLGGVYERILDFSAVPDAAGGSTLIRTGRRKATGAFYTPRSLTDALVRRTLAPLTEEASSAHILALRVLDPAMGSGAFLVAACRYLARAYEIALVREGSLGAADISETDRASFRRTVAQRCLYGVDLNPMAVQLGRLSLWLATLAVDRPLTFLDHHLRTGNTIVGASLADVARQRPSARPRRARSGPLPLFEWADLDGAVEWTIGPRRAIAEEAGDTLEQVRAKERLLSSLQQEDAPLARWKRVADLWCAGWFGRSAVGRRTPAADAPFDALVDEIMGRSAVLPPHISRELLAQAREVAARERFFHWPLEFPEVFHDVEGRPVSDGGFDAVMGNPPWEMLRTDHGEGTAGLTDFTRASGVYRFQGNGHANLYQLFMERALSLVRRGGRIGMLVPSGLATDHGCAALRRYILERTAIDTFVSFENREALFPVHRSLKFLALTATTGESTASLPCRFGVVSPDVLDEIPDAGAVPAAIHITRGLINRISGEQAAVPELRTALDLSIVSRVVFSVPALGDPAGWNVSFGRELNATEDRHHFVARPAATGRQWLPVLEGKQIQPFAVDVAAARAWIPSRVAERILDAGSTYRRDRLAYRDVAAATNRLTLIAAIVPAGTVTTHTIFCLKTGLDAEGQDFLCALFNSFVANYLVRLRVSTHVTVSIVSRLPAPKPSRGSPEFREMSALGRRLRTHPHDRAAAAVLQARAAALYRLTAAEFRHVLDSFPLVDAAERTEAMRTYEEMLHAEC